MSSAAEYCVVSLNGVLHRRGISVKSRIKKAITAAGLAVGLAAALVVGGAGSSTAAPPAIQAFGITGDGHTMAAFKINTPGQLDWVQDIVGLQDTAYAVGIDI